MQVDTRRRHLRTAGTGAMVTLLLVTAGCAQSPVDRESMEYARIDAQNQAAEQYESLRHKCRAAGGVMLVPGDWSRIKPAAINMKMARCASRIDNVIW